MRRAYLKGDVFALLVLGVFPLIAYAEPLLQHRLLGPGDGVALHLPLRTEAFRAYRDFTLPFLNTREFLATPLLEAYRGGVLYPLTILLAPFEVFSAFQALVLISMSLAGVLTYLYLKRLGARAPGAFVGALSFAYGPYLLNHFEDTAALVAAPMLPLVLLAAESHMNRATPGRLAGLGASIALLVLAGSPEALGAGAALLFGRLLLGHLMKPTSRTPPRRATLLAIGLGLAFSAPQWLPTIGILPLAGRQITGLGAEAAAETMTGLAGLILKTVTHTPAASLALASLPLMFARLPVRVLLIAVCASLALQVGRGPLLAPGALPLVLEFALAALAGLALDEQWKQRRTREGRRLRAYFLVASLASAGVLSIAAATLGALPEPLAAAVGVYAIALIAYFALAENESDVAASVFLVPLAVSFALQPTSRGVFQDAPTRSQLVAGTPTRRAIDRALLEINESPRILSLVRSFPADLALDLGFAGYGALAPRVQANGYDPMAPISVRRVLGEMGARGFLTETSLTPDPGLLRMWAIDALQVPTADLITGSPSPLDLSLRSGVRLAVAFPFVQVKDLTLGFGARSSPVRVSVRVNGDREVVIGTASPSRNVVLSPSYRIDAVILETETPSGEAAVSSITAHTADGGAFHASRLAAYLAQPAFREIVATPQIRVFRVLEASPLVSGAEPLRNISRLHPGGKLRFESPVAQEVRVATPWLNGWNAGTRISDASSSIRVDARAGTTVLAYRPALFLPGVFLFGAGLVGLGLLASGRLIPGAFVKTPRDERK